MKIMLIGKNGMLGQVLVKEFESDQLFSFGSKDLDITDEKAVIEKVKEIQPDIIINAAAYNDVDGIEDNFNFAKQVNGLAPVFLARAGRLVGAKLVHYSTDYVFSGNKGSAYLETDKPDPISKYGFSKLLGEEALSFNENVYIIRTSRLFGEPAKSANAKKSFVDVMLFLAEKNNEINIVEDEIGNPTYVKDLARFTKTLLEKDYKPGIYHGVNEGAVSWYDFAKKIFEITQKNVIIKPVKSDFFHRKAKRPANSELLNTKMIKLQSWQDALIEYLNNKTI